MIFGASAISWAESAPSKNDVYTIVNYLRARLMWISSLFHKSQIGKFRYMSRVQSVTVFKVELCA